MKPVALLALLCSCLLDQPPDGRPILGAPSDVTTPTGAYAGYRVQRTCPQTYVDIGVIGTGAIAPAADDIAAFGADLHARIADIASVWGWGGIALVCEPGVGTTVMLDDWRDVDTIIARAGDFLRDHDLALQVGISVDSIPVPAAE
jgi:hypothetical protein